ncbi:MAG: transporter substrate-binding domain-containing protein [Gammaproteobacteria bacterium]|nr:transporter substrate-binding domain-containing protein [Gammaproteobacteria bacterium]
MWYRWLLLLLLLSANTHAAKQLKSAVSGNFPNGLHAHFIKYISEQLNVEADIAHMPYARRLIELDDGSIDMMVGVSGTAPIGSHTILLKPAYDNLNIGLFVLAGNESLFAKADDMRKHLLSLTRHANSDAILSEIPAAHIVPARSLEQKIEMLLKGRIDGFLHVTQSTELRLRELGYTNNITQADYQPPEAYKQYIAVNNRSWLYAHKAELEAIIANGIANGDFQTIRRKYYAEAH